MAGLGFRVTAGTARFPATSPALGSGVSPLCQQVSCAIRHTNCPVYRLVLAPVLAEARAGRRDVYFADGAHFVYAAFLGWVWCVARLFVRAASGRKRYNVLGAVHAVTHRLIRVANHTYLNRSEEHTSELQSLRHLV